MTYRLILAFALFAASGQATWAGEKAPPMVAFQGVIKSFKDFGGRDAIDGGSDIHYGASKIRILSPAKFKNRELTVMEEMPVSRGAILRRVGRRISFKLQPGYLDSHVLFPGLWKTSDFFRSEPPAPVKRRVSGGAI